jgi:hypothetical protein
MRLVPVLKQKLLEDAEELVIFYVAVSDNNLDSSWCPTNVLTAPEGRERFAQ